MSSRTTAGIIGGHFTSREVPVMVSSFIGRVSELADVRRLITTERIVTLTGSGGCGKTRLGLKVLEDVGAGFGDGVVIVDLAPLTDEAAVAPLLAKTLGLWDSGAAPLELVGRFLQPMRALVFLDTCEHVIGACASLVEEVARRCPSVTVLATSREPLGVDGEVTYRVPSLAIPEPDAADIRNYESVALFLERARRVRPNFVLDEANAAGVGAICRRLDGVPLAVELAAARTRMMSIDQIVGGLDDRFRLLTGGARTALPRQRTLQASVDWSFVLLTEVEKTLFRRLAVFLGSFSLDAAEMVGGGHPVDPIEVLDLLSSLVDKSLVQATEDGRYRLLETIRHFAQGTLAEHADEAARARDDLLEFHGALAERARAGLDSEAVFDWLDRLEADNDNLSAALTWADQTSRFEIAGVIASDLARYWRLRGKLLEGRAALERALDRPAVSEATRARAAVAAAEIALNQWDLAAAGTFASDGLAASMAVGDATSQARAHIGLGWVAAWTGRHGEAEEHFRLADDIAEENHLPGVRANAVYGLGMVSFADGDFPAARPLLEAGADQARALGDVEQLLNNLWNLYLLNRQAGNGEAAVAAAEEGLRLATRLGNRDRKSIFLGCLAEISGIRGASAEARAMLEEARKLGDVSASLLPRLNYLASFGFLERTLGAAEPSIAALSEAGAVFQAASALLPSGFCFAHAAEVACAVGDLDRAAVLVESAAALRAQAGERFPPADLAEAHLALARGELARAEELFHDLLGWAIESGSVPSAMDSLDMLGLLAIRQGSVAEGARLLGAAERARRERDWTRPATLALLIGESLALAQGDPGYAEGLGLTVEEAAAYAHRGRGERKRPSFGWASLTPTELQVVGLVAEGLSNAEICDRLFVSLGTVKTHLSHVFTKLGLRSRLQLAKEFSQRPAG